MKHVIIPTYKKKKRNTNKDITYLIKDTINNQYKIGRSVNPYNRYKQLRTANPYILLIGTTNTPEKELHKKYNKYRISGEWFDLPNTMVNQVINEFKEYNHISKIRKVKDISQIPDTIKEWYSLTNSIFELRTLYLILTQAYENNKQTINGEIQIHLIDIISSRNYQKYYDALEQLKTSNIIEYERLSQDALFSIKIIDEKKELLETIVNLFNTNIRLLLDKSMNSNRTKNTMTIDEIKLSNDCSFNDVIKLDVDEIKELFGLISKRYKNNDLIRIHLKRYNDKVKPIKKGRKFKYVIL